MTNKIDIHNENYPELLKQIDDPPQNLYIKGDIEADIFQNCLGVVGSRKVTPYGIKGIHHLLSGLSDLDITIVSGFMYGADAESHAAAMQYGLKTIAVLPCGVEIIHPEYQFELYNSILETNGLIMSELPGYEAPQRWYYPKRNRIVAGLCKAVVIIEAQEKSGSLITASLANKYSRKVFALPGSIFSTQSTGCLSILKTYADLITSSDDILKYYFPESDSYCSKRRGNHSNYYEEKQVTFGEQVPYEEQIYKMLASTPMSIDEIVQQIKISVSDVNTILIRMCVSGLLQEINHVYYVC